MTTPACSWPRRPRRDRPVRPPGTASRPPLPAQLREPGYPPHAILRKVTSSGNTSYHHKLIQVGKRWAGATVRIVAVGELVHIYHGDSLARVLASTGGERSYS